MIEGIPVWVQVIVVLITGGGLAQLIGHLVSRRNAVDSSEIERLRLLYDQTFEALQRRVDLLQQDNERLREIEQRAAELEREVERLRYHVLMLESAHQDLPVAMWLKDREGRMLALNKAYEEEFLRPLGKTRDDYIGHTDFAIWPQPIAKVFRDNDLYVIRTGEVLYTIEEVPDGEGVLHEYIIIKYPRKVGGVTIGTGGIAIRTDIKKRAKE